MKIIVIILCIIGIFFAGWKFIDDRMKQNKIEHMEHALSLAQHNPKKAVEYLREHIGNQNMPAHIVARLANPHERVNRLYPQNADWQDWAYLMELDIRRAWFSRKIYWVQDAGEQQVILEARLRDPEKEYAGEAARAERIAREKRARERRLREERQNRWVIVQLEGRPEVRFDISNDKGRASLIRWYNNTFHPEPHETRTVGRTRSGRRVGVKVEKLPGIAVPVGRAIMWGVTGNVAYDLAKEVGNWALKKGILKNRWAHEVENHERRMDIARKILHIPGTDNLTRKELRERVNLVLSGEIAKENFDTLKMIDVEDKRNRIMNRNEPPKRGLRDRDSPEWPQRKMIKGPQTRHPQGNDGPQTGHPEYE